MTRYVQHRMGIVIGSGNVFCFRRNNELKSFRAILFATDYLLDQYTSANMIDTPVQQVLWQRVRSSDGYSMSPREVSYAIKGWLEKNVGKKGEAWDHRDVPESKKDSLFFARRKDAVALSRYITNDILKGLSFERPSPK